MKKQKNIQIILSSLFALSILILPFASSAKALSVNVGASGSANTNVRSGDDDNDEYLNVNGKAQEDTSISKDDDTEKGTVKNQEKASVLSNIEISKDNVNDDSNNLSISSANEVNDNLKLKAFAQKIIKSDVRAREVASDDNGVAVSYDGKGKLFGFIPVGIWTKAAVASDGKVVLKHPWYRFFTSVKEDKTVQAQITEKVSATIDAYKTAKENGTLTAELEAQLKAKLISDIHAILQANAIVSANGKTK